MERNRKTSSFEDVISQPEDSIDLAVAALLIAKDEYPDLDIHNHLKKIDELAKRVNNQLNSVKEKSFLTIIQQINMVLFEQEGFYGNIRDYYDPRNSFLNEVLNRRTGIPVTLSLVYMEIGKRLGIQFFGIGMPGHFIVKGWYQGSSLLIDPFHQGRLLNEEDCQKQLREINGKNVQFISSYLDTLNKCSILCRILVNLKMIYLKKKDFSRALNVIEKIILLSPQQPREIRDRGLVHLQLNYFSAAIQDWKKYLQLDPKAPDVEQIRNKLRQVALQVARQN